MHDGVAEGVRRATCRLGTAEGMSFSRASIKVNILGAGGMLMRKPRGIHTLLTRLLLSRNTAKGYLFV